MTRTALLLTVLALVAALALTLAPGEALAAGIDGPTVGEQPFPQASPDQGGAGVNGYKATDWITFAVPLGAFLPAIIGLLWLTLRIDRSEGRE